MASLCTCDKCGKEIDYKTRCFTSVVYKEDGDIHTDAYDLCIECSTKLHTLVKHFVKSGNHEILHKFMTIEEETTHDTEMVSIPVEKYDSLNRMIAHYDNDNKELWKAVHDISVRIAKVCCTKEGENKNE